MIIIVGLTLGVASTLGYVGYYAFGNGSKSIILYNLPNEDGWSTAAKILYIITMMGSFPLVAHPIFHLLENSDFYKYGTFYRDEASTPSDDISFNSNFNSPESYIDWVKFFLVRTGVISIIYFISILIPNISILLTFLGALLGTIINVWIPVLFYNRAYNNNRKNLALKKMDL